MCLLKDSTLTHDRRNADGNQTKSRHTKVFFRVEMKLGNGT